VELGKTLAKAIEPVLTGAADAGQLDASTRALIEAIRSQN